jgi:hypothetical protein
MAALIVPSYYDKLLYRKASSRRDLSSLLVSPLLPPLFLVRYFKESLRGFGGGTLVVAEFASQVRVSCSR